ncbi:uncharacterized protein LOC119676033 [Teleopsis dalmanni]|uniref:uncharacterized protein LOC119676033 n=1 Tax=Teleopsis dalmanni TaxID=139649 RepID=UPI0018CE763F|nr:uncharacterized protein LOC119676033 [Teleopsis dalmanni]
MDSFQYFGVNVTDLKSAIQSMRYHSQMMQKYMALHYLANNILNNEFGVQSLAKRSGIPFKNNGSNVENNKNAIQGVNHFLEKEGLPQYASWLKKIAILDDIQDQMSFHSNKNKLRSNYHNEWLKRSTPYTDNTFNVSEFDEGDITGYAFNSNSNDNNNNNSKLWKLSSNNHPPSAKFYKRGLEKKYSDYRIKPHLFQSEYYSTESQQQPYNIGKSATIQALKKEISLKDVTDIALTTLAFLSFGIFMLQVLMCITVNKIDTTSLMMLPIEATEVTEASDGVEEIRRRRRSVSNQNQLIYRINNICKNALLTINSELFVTNDNGSCRNWLMCVNNQEARQQRNGQAFWIPIWNYALSWLTTQINADIPYPPITHTLKSIVVGIKNKNCDQYFKKKCSGLR